MIKKRGKEIYQPPYAQDLSGFSANGQEVKPMGECTAGPTPYYNCTTGPAFESSCVGGTAPDTSHCDVGGYHTSPTCNPGSSAATICISGGAQN